MNHKIKTLFRSWKIIILLLFLVFSVVAISPDPFVKGVAIRGVTQNSSASDAGISISKASSMPMSREVITSIDDRPVLNLDDYYTIISGLKPNISIGITTNMDSYIIKTRAAENSTDVDLGLSVYDAPTTNIRKGLDLQGGTRVVLQPETKISDYDMSTLIDSMKERLNVYGLSDIVVRDAGDLSGNQYVVVEIAGATEDEIKDLLAKQGKFEAKIGNATVFRGGKDITFVCRSADCSGIDSRRGGCGATGNGDYSCAFSFSIAMSVEAAERFAEATKNLAVVDDSLSEKLELYLDDRKVDDLNIASGLKGKAETRIEISGGGAGPNEQAATYATFDNMKRLQTILITGSLPVKLNIIKTDSVSPALGKGFVKNAITMSLLAILAVSVVIVIRYRKLIIAVPILITMLAEVIILLGIAALIGWNIDLAAIAGILTAIGTGVDDQIVITDETLKGETSQAFNWRDKIKRAFLIIMLAYLTVVVAMIPLIFAGAGLLKGFAITTIIGVTVGVFITRPAYGVFIELFLKE